MVSHIFRALYSGPCVLPRSQVTFKHGWTGDLFVDVPMPENVASADQPSEGERWLKECNFRERDYLLRDREVSIKEGELEAKRIERELLRNPFALALIAATIAALANVFVAFNNAGEQRVLERSQAEHGRIVSAIAGDERNARDKLRFLLKTYLIEDEATRKHISDYLESSEIKTATSTPPPPPIPAATRVTVDSGWLEGGHNPSEVCGRLLDQVQAQHPGKAVTLVGSSEDGRKDFLAHVTYNYHCTYDVS